MDVYKIDSFTDRAKGNSYVGRGIVTGMTPGGRAASAYFIMGRSANSRNRVFTIRDGAVYTEPFDASKVEDPSLIIYAAIREYGDSLIVTNGDQTDTIRDFMAEGKSFEEALRTRQFEPDGPNWTPRISGLLKKDGSYLMSILKSADPEGSACARYTFEYPGIAGVGHYLHTYLNDGDPIPTFQGEPERVAIDGDIDAFTQKIWENLNEANKISLYVRFTDLETGAYQETIVNKYH